MPSIPMSGLYINGHGNTVYGTIKCLIMTYAMTLVTTSHIGKSLAAMSRHPRQCCMYKLNMYAAKPLINSDYCVSGK